METCTVMVITDKNGKEETKYYDVQLPEHFTEDLPDNWTKEFLRKEIEKTYQRLLYKNLNLKIISAKFDSIESKFPSSL